jgi:hypothetical protein
MSLRRSRTLGLVAIALCAVAPTLAACSVENTLPPPYCFEEGSGLIVAQSVPTASQIPCFGDLPSGWSFGSVLVNEQHTVVRLDSDRVGDDAAVLRLERTCDRSGAIPAPSDQPAAARYDMIEQLRPGLRAKQFYVFRGGCVWWTFDFDSGTSATEAVAVDDALVLVSRADLNEAVRETFIDEEI